MRDSTTALWKLLRTGRPVGCVLYEDYAAREQLIELSYLVAPSSYEVRRVEEASDAFQVTERATLLLFVPRNEIDAVRSFDTHLEMLGERTAPVVMYLLRR